MKNKSLKVDLVYTWMDGYDEKWLNKKNYWLDQVEESSLCDVSKKRYESNDELKYSLRSVEAFVPWVNHIFIVVNNQKPN